MKTKIVVAVIILSMVLSGCSAAAKTADNFAGEMGFAPAPEAMPMEQSVREEYGYSPSYDAASSTSDIQVEDMKRMVIRNAELSIVVEDPIVASNAIGRMAERMGGYVVSSNSWKTRNFRDIEVPEANIQIRVPSELLNQALEEIKSLLTNKDIDLLSENVSGQDVTKEYTDLNSRLRNLEDAEEQLRKILDEAYKTEDVLNVFNQLTYYREQIEITKGQIKYYEESAALSSISVRIQAQEAVNPITIAGWKPSVTISKALQQLVNAFQVIVDGAIYLVLLIIPIIIVILLPFYLLFLLISALVRKNRKKKQEIQEINKE